MASSCVTTPTLTRTDVLTTQSQSTTVSTSVSTAPPTVTTLTTVVTACAGSGSVSSCGVSTTTITSTIPGSTTTVEVTQVTAVPVTTTLATTLFGTSCTVINTDNGVTSQPITTPSETPTVVTPPPSIVTSSWSSTQPDGNVVVTQETQTYTFSPSTINPNPSDSADRGGGPPIGPIVGGVVGGFGGLIAIVLLVWFFMRRRKRWDDIFDRDEDAILSAAPTKVPKRDPPPEPKPKPYEYGLVGHGPTPIQISPIASPVMANSQPLSTLTSHQQQQQQSQVHHRHTSSLTPLLSVSSLGGSSTGGQASVTARPSTGSSMGGSHEFTHVATVQGAQPQLPSGAAWGGPGIGGYPPGMQMNLGNNNMNAGLNIGGSGGQQRVVIANPDLAFDAYANIDADNAGSSASGSASGAHGYPPGIAPSVMQSQQPQRDGKGRVIIRASEKRPIVHLDGGRYPENRHHSSAGRAQQQQQQQQPAEPAPPAYEA
ncbi:hypothetical protein AMATHDRAFT_58509 [Amanita thiersii Skay4041]|uniref:REJ domain-containing protein n=1 Tax=Amanita thiersii Skay4041 TaxID=703135 RepID=A0A2A9NMD3_9AGAR|nr:hypothetical protein AMATHDRAFT_58509 [Amanita thiersii Skay4041]